MISINLFILKLRSYVELPIARAYCPIWVRAVMPAAGMPSYQASCRLSVTGVFAKCPPLPLVCASAECLDTPAW